MEKEEILANTNKTCQAILAVSAQVLSDESITDGNYFFFEILARIANNYLAILRNDSLFPAGSHGLDLNARLLIEYISVLKKYNDGKFEEKLLKDFKDGKDICCFKRVDKEIDRYMGKKFLDYYNFSGLMLHPHLISDEYIQKISKRRISLLGEMLAYVVNTLNSMHLVEDWQVKDDLNIEFISELKEFNLNFSYLNRIIRNLAGPECGGHYLYRTLGDLICVLRDIVLSYECGFYEDVVIKFKTFVERVALHETVYYDEGGDLAPKSTETMVMSSSLQIELFLKEADEGYIEKDLTNDLEALRRKYYGKIPKEQFDGCLKNGTLFFFKGDNTRTSYHSLVKSVLEEYDELLKRDLNTNSQRLIKIYKTSVRYSHATGLLFCNKKEEESAVSKEIVQFVCYYMDILIQSFEDSLSESEHWDDISNLLDRIHPFLTERYSYILHKA